MRLALFFIIQWFNTTVEVPVTEPIADYKRIPQAVYYNDDNTEKKDTVALYQYGRGNELETVNTNVIGEYTVTYVTRFVHDFKNEHTQEITFKVVDKKAPIVLSSNVIKIPLKSKLPDPSAYITYEDNYDEVSNIKVSTIGYNQIRTDITGTFDFNYEITDGSDNKTIHKSSVVVYDDQPPTVKQKREMRLQLDDRIDIYQYFEFNDNYDEVLNVEYQLDTGKIGKFIGKLNVSDQSGNETILSFVYYVDKKKDEIEFRRDYLKISIDDYSRINEILKENVTNRGDSILFDSPSCILGKQNIYFYELDHLGYQNKQLMTLEFYDDQAPTYKILKELKIEVNELEPYIMDYIELEDNYDKKLTAKQTGKVNTQVIGEYRIILEVMDQSKNTTTIPLIFSVVDTIPPKVKIIDEIIVKDFKKPNYEKYMQIEDNYDKNCSIEVITYNDYKTIGKYPIELSIKDRSNNETKVTVTITIADTSIPKIYLKNDEIHLNYPNNYIDYEDYIKYCEDDYDNLTNEDVEITHNIDFNKIGRYQIRYYLEDSSKNSTEEFITVYIKDKTPPAIKVEEYYKFDQGKVPHLLTLCTAYDEYDKEVDHLITVTPSNLSKAGKYEVIYEVHDNSGNYANKKVIIEVLPTYKYKVIIIIVVTLTFLIILVYTIWRSKKRKNFDNSNNYTNNE